MSSSHAVVFVDHAHAQFLQLDAEHLDSHQVKSHTHPTAQHHSEVRAVHEFFGHVCDSIDAVEEALVVGPRQGIADFQHYVGKHRHDTARRIVGYDVVDRPTEHQLAALGREFFAGRARGDAVESSER